MFQLDAYLERIGLGGRDSPPSLAELQAAHVTSIRFEGFDAHMGVTPLLDADALADKLVAGGRGGYCFELNLLFKAALEALGYTVEPYLARVMLGGVERPATHLALRVRGGPGEQAPGGAGWHVDVGFGSGTPLEPLPWGPAGEHEQAGWRFQVVERGPQWVLQTLDGGAWIDVYGFVPVPAPQPDIEMSNWWVSTHPDSAFVTGFLVTRQWPDGRRLILSDWGELMLSERTPTSSELQPVTREQVPAMLAERFELRGFMLDETGRITRAPARARA